MQENNYEKPILSDEELEKISRDDLVVKWKQLNLYVENLELLCKENLNKLNSKSYELAKLKNMVLMNYSSFKDNETSQSQSQSFQNISTANAQDLSTDNDNITKTKLALVDPTVNAIIIELKKELEEVRKKKEELQNELNSTKFNPESQLTKRLMFKCNKLIQENEEIGKLISAGNVAQLENDLAYHKQLLTETYENEQNVNTFLIEIDNEMDVMQANILQLQERLNSQQHSFSQDENINSINNEDELNLSKKKFKSNEPINLVEKEEESLNLN